MYSMTMYGRPPASPTSKIVTMFGSLDTRAAARASRANRRRAESSATYGSASSFTATTRSSVVSVAR